MRLQCPKTEMMHDVAKKLNLPIIDVKFAISNQMSGLPITTKEQSESTIKIEYQLKANSGRVVMIFDMEERARKEAESRGLACFRVTTITEKL